MIPIFKAALISEDCLVLSHMSEGSVSLYLLSGEKSDSSTSRYLFYGYTHKCLRISWQVITSALFPK